MTIDTDSFYEKRKFGQTCLTLENIRQFVLDRFNDVQSTKELVHFHTINKYLFMSLSPANLNKLGSIVANHDKKEISILLSNYHFVLTKILQSSPTTKSHSNTLYHILGHFSKDLDKYEKLAIITMIDTYRNDECSLSTVLSVMKEFTSKFDKTYLIRQTYFLLFLNSYVK